MIDILLNVNNVSFSNKLSTYQVTHEIEYPRILTALDGTEYGTHRRRPVVLFSFIPLTEAETNTFYEALKQQNLTVQYTDTHLNRTAIASMRLTTNLDAVFGIKSITGDRYYKGGTITLRQRTVL